MFVWFNSLRPSQQSFSYAPVTHTHTYSYGEFRIKPQSSAEKWGRCLVSWCVCKTHIPSIAGSNGSLRINANVSRSMQWTDTMRTDTNRYGLHTFHYLPLPLDTSKYEKIPLDADCCVYLVDLFATADFAPYHSSIVFFNITCMPEKKKQHVSRRHTLNAKHLSRMTTFLTPHTCT